MAKTLAFQVYYITSGSMSSLAIGEFGLDDATGVLYFGTTGGNVAVGSITGVTAGTGLTGGGTTGGVTVNLSVPVTPTNGGTGSNLSSTGGPLNVVTQATSGGDLTSQPLPILKAVLDAQGSYP